MAADSILKARRRRRPSSAGPAAPKAPAFITRQIPAYELLSEEGLVKLENQADWLLSQIGIEIRGDEVTLKLFKDAGATVNGEHLRFDPGLIRSLCATAPKTYTMHARNSDRNIDFAGDNLILAPAYGPPFVTDLKGGRRYGMMADFENFIKLTYMTPWLHHQSGTICEPVDVAVNKRHLDMVYAHLRYSDKPFMGSVTAPERAEDSLAMARIMFGEKFMQDHLVIQGNINVNSPLVYDDTMTGALRTYAGANQGNVISPFILSGAMSPVTQAALISQAHAEAMVGIALTQLVRPGAPTFGTPESSLSCLAISQLCRRLGLPFCSGSHLTDSKIADAQAMQESTDTMNPALMAGANFIFQSAGWLEGGLTIGYEKFVMDIDKCGAIARLAQGLNLDENEFARDAYLEAGVGSNFLGVAHAMKNFRTANYRAELADTNSFEQWTDDGSKGIHQRAYELWNKMLADYEAPQIDVAVDDALKEFIAKRKASMVDAWY